MFFNNRKSKWNTPCLTVVVVSTRAIWIWFNSCWGLHIQSQALKSTIDMEILIINLSAFRRLTRPEHNQGEVQINVNYNSWISLKHEVRIALPRGESQFDGPKCWDLEEHGRAAWCIKGPKVKNELRHSIYLKMT